MQTENKNQDQAPDFLKASVSGSAFSRELRIDNWVEIIQPTKGVYTTIQNSCFSVNIEKTYKPIILTEEWLLKFGFVLFGEKATDSTSPGDWYWIKKDFRFAIDNITNRVQNLSVTLKSVHQLQNLYFALTGSELSITEADR